MSTNGTRTIIWRNGEDQFCLAKVGDILALEEKCGCGLFEIIERLNSVITYAAHDMVGGRARLNDVRETIRIGLIGGGMTPEKAMSAVKLHVDGQPLLPSVMIAHAVLTAAIVGVPDDPVGKHPAAGAETQAEVSSTTTAASAAPASSESEPPSSGPPASPTDTHSGSLPPLSMASTAQTPATSFRPIL